MEFYDFPFSWEWKIIATDFHSHIFQRGWASSTTKQLWNMVHFEMSLSFGPSMARMMFSDEFMTFKLSKFTVIFQSYVESPEGTTLVISQDP